MNPPKNVNKKIRPNVTLQSGVAIRRLLEEISREKDYVVAWGVGRYAPEVSAGNLLDRVSLLTFREEGGEL